MNLTRLNKIVQDNFNLPIKIDMRMDEENGLYYCEFSILSKVDLIFTEKDLSTPMWIATSMEKGVLELKTEREKTIRGL